MAGSKATRTPNVWDRLREQQNTINNDKARNRRVFNPQTVAIPPNPEIPPAGKSGSDTGNALPTAGGTMIGAIAYFPKLVSLTQELVGKPASATSNVLDISKGIGADSSRIILAGVNGAVGEFDLEFIKGAAHAGQYLNIQGVVGNTITIKNDESGNGSAGLNIRTQTGGDLFVVDNANIELIFDSTQNQWTVIGGGTGELGASALIEITADQLTDGVVLWDTFVNFGDPAKVQDQGNGVYRCFGDIFTVEAVMGVEMNELGGGSTATGTWEQSPNGVDSWTIFPDTQNVVSIFNTGRPSLTTQPFAAALFDANAAPVFVRFNVATLIGTFTRILQLPTYGIIRSTVRGSSGGGGGGATSLGQLTDVTVSPNPPISNDILQFNTTLGQWENQPASAGGGLLVDLSNLQAGAVPPVDMSLNNFDLENVTEIRMNAAGTGLIDNIQHLDFFQVNHNIQSFGDRIDYQVDAADSHHFINGSTTSAEIRSHGIDALDIRFPNAGAVAQNTWGIAQENLNLSFNVPDTRSYSWNVNKQLAFTMTDDTLRGDFFIADTALIATNQANAFPPDGWIQQFSNDVIIGSGGNFVNITDLFDSVGGQFEDTTFAIFDNGDNTKVATFDAAAISTGNTRTYNFQDANGRLAMLDGAQQDFTVNVGLGGNSLVSVGGIFTDSATADLGQNTNYFDDLFINQIFFFGDASLGYKIGGSVTDGFDFVVPDVTREFDFYFDGGVTPSWIIRPTVIDAQGGRLEDLEEIQFDGNSNFPTPSAVRKIGFDGVAAKINMPTGGSFILSYNGSPAWTATVSSLNGDNLILNDTLTFNDSVGVPSTGQIVRNGADLLVSTTEGVKNMKDIGSGGGGGTSDRIQSPDTLTSVIAIDSAVTTRIQNTARTTVTGSGMTMNGNISMNGGQVIMGSGNITGVNRITMNNSSTLIDINGGDITDFQLLQGLSNNTSQINMVEGTIIDVDELTLHQGGRILSENFGEIGIQVDNASATVGSAGMMAMPVVNLPIPPTKANLDSAFGTHKGSMGFDSPSFPPTEVGSLFIRDADGSWYRFIADGRTT